MNSWDSIANYIITSSSDYITSLAEFYKYGEGSI